MSEEVKEEPPAKRQKTENKCIDDLAVIVHWGIYSVPAFDSVASGQLRTIQNGSEWYEKRLIAQPSDFPFPVSGWKPTQAYHTKTFGPETKYADFATTFNQQIKLNKWNPDNWMKLWVQAGVSSVILTAKHHDGFCLWPSSTTSFKSELDLVKAVKESAIKHGLKFGIYYSWGEFREKPNAAYIKLVEKQIDELCKYEPSVFWCDGDWLVSGKQGQTTIDHCVSKIKRLLPHCEINDRIGHKRVFSADRNHLGLATYRVYADRFMPSTRPHVPWEHINTIGLSWGYNREQKQEHYKTGQQLCDIYRQVQQLGGRFLLNFGPQSGGDLDPFEVDAFLEFTRRLI